MNDDITPATATAQQLVERIEALINDNDEAYTDLFELLIGSAGEWEPSSNVFDELYDLVFQLENRFSLSPEHRELCLDMEICPDHMQDLEICADDDMECGDV